ncbi:MAG TPA: hypothetical protein VIK80_01570 [Flavihumibacter sp.]|jgi:hypothetical protein
MFSYPFIAAGIGAETLNPTKEAMDLYKKGVASLLMKENKEWHKNKKTRAIQFMMLA